MNSSSIAVALLVLGVVPALSFGQTPAKPEPPPGPLLANAPEMSQWVTIYSYIEDRAAALAHDGKPLPPENRTRSITTTKTRDIIHEEFVDGTGAKFDEWHVGPALYMKDGGSTQWSTIAPNASGSASGSINYSHLPSSGFRDLDWITRDEYVGTIKMGDKSALVFAQGAPQNFFLKANPDPAQPSQSEQLDSFGLVAYIDVETRLPIQVQVNGVVRYYRFGPEPTAVQPLPPDLNATIEKCQEVQDRLSQRLPRPY